MQIRLGSLLSDVSKKIPVRQGYHRCIDEKEKGLVETWEGPTLSDGELWTLGYEFHTAKFHCNGVAQEAPMGQKENSGGFLELFKIRRKKCVCHLAMHRS